MKTLSLLFLDFILFISLNAQTSEKEITWKKDCDDFGKCQLVFKDDFSSNINKWPLQSDTKKGLVEIVNGRGLRIKTVKDISIAQWIKVDISQQEAYTLETNVTFKSGPDDAGYGLIWGFKDWDNYQYFFINNTGSFTYGSKYEGIITLHNRWYYSSKINKGKSPQNRLQVIKKLNKTSLAINGEFLDSYESGKLAGKGFGLLLDKSKSEIFAQNFIIRKSEETNNSYAEKIDDENCKSFGSGLIISTTSNIVVTNYHVIKESSGAIFIEVKLPEGLKTFKAKELVSDKINDLVLLKLEDANLQNELGAIPYKISNTNVPVGAPAFTLGYPLSLALGKEVKFTDGKISSKTGFQGELCCYQISVPVQPGNSGGPLFDSNGDLIGIISAKITNADNISYAIKSSYLINLLDAISEPMVVTDNSKLAASSATEKIKELSRFTILVKVK